MSSSLILPLSYSSYLMLIGSERRQTKTFFKENNIHGKAKPASSETLEDILLQKWGSKI